MLDVFESQNQFRVVVGSTAQSWSGVPLPWSTLKRRQPIELLEPYHNDLAEHTAQAAAAVPERWAGNEGQLQTLFARHSFPDVTVIDREAVVGFSTVQEQEQVRSELAPRFATVLTRARQRWSEPEAPESWAEADFLALDADGRLSVIEVKRGNDRRLGWTPAQVAYYAALFRRWASDAGPVATETIELMLTQRERLRLIPRERPRVAAPLEVFPVVAVGTPITDSGLRRLHEMASALVADPELDCGPIVIWRIDPIDVSLTLDEVN